MKKPKLDRQTPKLLRQLFKVRKHSDQRFSLEEIKYHIAEIKKNLPPEMQASFRKSEEVISSLESYLKRCKESEYSLANFWFQEGIDAGAQFVMECWKLAEATEGRRREEESWQYIWAEQTKTPRANPRVIYAKAAEKYKRDHNEEIRLLCDTALKALREKKPSAD